MEDGVAFCDGNEPNAVDVTTGGETTVHGLLDWKSLDSAITSPVPSVLGSKTDESLALCQTMVPKIKVETFDDALSNSRGTDRHTDIKLSRLDCLIGVLFPGKAKRKVEKTIVTETVDENEYTNNRGSPWIIPFNVLSKNKTSFRFISKAAKCTVDTGILQGNIVSKEFLYSTLRYSESAIRPLSAAQCIIDTGSPQSSIVSRRFLLNTLGHPESAIDPLKDSDKYGGSSTTGDILITFPSRLFGQPVVMRSQRILDPG